MSPLRRSLRRPFCWDLKKGIPLLMLENDVFTRDNKPIEYNKVLFRGDRIKLRIEYNKDY